MVTRRILIYGLGGLVVLFFIATIAGCAVKVKCVGRIAPGVMFCGTDLSGMQKEEVLIAVEACIPKFLLEMRCRFPAEMKEKVETKVKTYRSDVRLEVLGNELCLTVDRTMLRVLSEETVEAVVEKSSEVKVWEWLYAAVMKKPFQTRPAEVRIVWEEEYFGELLSVFVELLEREKTEATVAWEDGKIRVTESEKGFRLDTQAAWQEAEQTFTETTRRLAKVPTEGVVIRFALKGTVLMPSLSTERAKQCDTKLAEFVTRYQGVGSGRSQNIAAGAAHLHGEVILPGEEFSTAKALLPFTKENGYASGGTYIDGQLAESIGGGVCQLSTTLYNALLYTDLEITRRYPHSIPVGYILPGRDAAIAGDYKDLCFRNTTKAPVLLLCETAEGEVKVTLYGTGEAMRENVTLESVITEETKEGVTVEVYRVEKAEGGAEFRERISRDRYRYLEKGE